MPAEVRLSPKARRIVLEQLSRDRLRELTTRLELEVTDRRSTDSYVDAIVRKHSLDFAALLAELRREELQAACEALGLDCSGREKAKLVARILGEEPAAPKEPPAKTSEKPAASEEPAAAEVRNEGALKSSLRRFVLALAGGLRGRDAATTFTSRLLQCFGWPEAGPPGVTMPAPLAVVENGRRAQRDVALFWQDRRVLLDVVKHDVMLDFAWKEMFRTEETWVLYRDDYGHERAIRASAMRGVSESLSAGTSLVELWLEGDLGVGDPLVRSGGPAGKRATGAML